MTQNKHKVIIIIIIMSMEPYFEKLGLNVNCNISRTVSSLGPKSCTFSKGLRCAKSGKKIWGGVVSSV